MATKTLRHHLIVRVTHAVNALALAIMIGSGLRIFNAYPAFARKGESFCCYPFAGDAIPAWLTFGGWLAGARHWHFAAMWLLVVNGLVYLGFIYLHGEWRDLVPRRGVARDSLEMLKFYFGRRKVHPRQGKHNALQRMVYFALPWVAAAAVVSGVAIWKPVQLAPLTHLLGGYVWARYWHFLAMLALVALSFGHVFMVFAVDPYALRAITTGGYDDSKSPEARNARPFVNLRAKAQAQMPPSPEPEPPPSPEPEPPPVDPPNPAQPTGDSPPAPPITEPPKKS
ncbi:MAG TPA: cytochrome b/b6 domain-containing protein [Polyangia bacterium]|jgi:thiosulfate reductase cytochrome b subunit|nr:cytochrome b/b6 domain-containing protein [Polyangia bacterium]